MREFDYYEADDAEHAVTLADELDNAKFIAGGQSLVNIIKQRMVEPDLDLIDIQGITALQTIEKKGDEIEIGALATHNELVHSPLLQRHVPELPEVVSRIADVQIRNMGTIGGNVAHADPASDYPVFLSAIDAELEIRSTGGSRTVAATEFFEGYFTTDLDSGELISKITIPIPDDWTEYGFDKFAQRKGDFPLVNAASRLRFEDERCTDAMILVGCVQGTPISSGEGSSYLVSRFVGDIDPEESGQRAAREIEPDPNEKVDSQYQKDLVKAVVSNSIKSCL